MNTKRKSIIWAYINLAGFILTITVNALANILPLNNNTTGDLSDAYLNLFVPAGLTFSVWGVIYLLLTGFVVYQLVRTMREDQQPVFAQKIGPFFLLSSLANTAWIFAWHWEKPGLSMLIMVLILYSLIMIYLRLNINREGRTGLEKVWVELPFSVYLGWITVATIANATAFLVDSNWSGFGISEITWTILMIAAAVLITGLIVLKRKDTGYTLVVLWALLGIFIKRSGLDIPPDQGVELAVLIGMGIIIISYALRLIIPGVGGGSVESKA